MVQHYRRLEDGRVVEREGPYCTTCGAQLGTLSIHRKYHGPGICIPKFSLVRELNELNK